MTTVNPVFADMDKLQRALGGDDPLLSLAQASKQLGVPLSTLSDAVRNKRLPALVMPDSRRYVRQSAVKAYVTRHNKAKSHPEQMDDSLLNIAALANDPSVSGLLPNDFGAQHDHYLYGTPKRK